MPFILDRVRISGGTTGEGAFPTRPAEKLCRAGVVTASCLLDGLLPHVR